MRVTNSAHLKLPRIVTVDLAARRFSFVNCHITASLLRPFFLVRVARHLIDNCKLPHTFCPTIDNPTSSSHFHRSCVYSIIQATVTMIASFASPGGVLVKDDDANMSASSGSMGEDKKSEIYSASSGTGTGLGAASEASSGDLRDKLIRNEERAVVKTRIIVAVVLVICAASVSAVVYLFASTSEQSNFMLSFNGHAAAITSTVQWEIQYNFALMQQVSAAMTSSALMMNSSFPYMTHPSFEVSAGYADGMGGIMSVAWAPRVMQEERSEWESYSVANQGWIQESERLREVHQGHRDAVHGTFQDHEHDRRLIEDITEITDEIWHWENGTKVLDPVNNEYYPIWQTSPPDATPINSNILADPGTKLLFENMQQLNASVLTGYTQIYDLWDWMFDPEEKVQKSDPHMYLMEPVYAAYEESPERVGVLIGLTSWANMFSGLLAEGENGVICVVRDTCGMNFSYVLNGKEATFMGVGDLHNTNWDGYEHEVQLELYEDVPDSICLHDLIIYPSDEFYAIFQTNQAWISTGIVIAAFCMMSLVFILYDYRVTKRQEKTMDSAIRTNKMVASLFPENVRERLMEDADQQLRAQKKSKLPGFKRKEVEESNNLISVTRPIADFFPHVVRPDYVYLYRCPLLDFFSL